MVQINWTDQSILDLQHIYEYIAQDSAKYAKTQVIRIRERARLIEENIRIGKPVPEFKNPDVREVFEGRYRIIYRAVNNSQADILTVYHSARILDSL